MPKSLPAFPPSFYARYQVQGLSPRQIDELLGNGWFRNDLNVYTAAIRSIKGSLRSSVMLRIPLENFSWKKRLKKLMRRNEGLFRADFRPFKPSEEKEAVWRIFKSTIHQWALIPKLSAHLLRKQPPEAYQTWELLVYFKDKLVAFSIFDRGLTSIASHEAAYDPAFQQYSLGIYTMLLEIGFCIENGLDHYYPGFLPRDVPMFDYKLRTGGVEFFRLKEKKWLPWGELRPEDWLMEQVIERLENATGLLQGMGLITRMSYGLFNHRPNGACMPQCYNVLLVATLPMTEQAENNYLIAWDPLQDMYFVFCKNEAPALPSEPQYLQNGLLKSFDVTGHQLYGQAENEGELLGLVQKMIVGRS